MNNTNQIPTVTVNGQEVPNFVPANDVQAAIVPLVVLQKLASLLPSANLDEIKRDMRAQISQAEDIQQYVDALETEVNFHKTINLIAMYSVPAERLEYAH